MHTQIGDFPAAKAAFEEALELAREVRDPIDEGVALLNLGIVMTALNDRDGALGRFATALEVSQQAGDQLTTARTLLQRGRAYTLNGENEAALTDYQRALAIAHAIGDRETAELAATLLHNQALLGREAESRAIPPHPQSVSPLLDTAISTEQAPLADQALQQIETPWRIHVHGYMINATEVARGNALVGHIISPKDGYLIVVRASLVEQRARETDCCWRCGGRVGYWHPPWSSEEAKP